jgi:hypothetical protein
VLAAIRSCVRYPPHPRVVHVGDGAAISAAHARGIARLLPMAIYPEDLFTTGNDDDNRAAVRALAVADLRLAGLAVYGLRTAVDKVFKGLSLHT